jgi:L-alanine-DL-glutamate epimerase-like enolase superfamily enzyme
MSIDSISAAPLEIRFRAAFRHASAERAQTLSLRVEARAAERSGVGEGCPRDYVTGETLQGALAFVEHHRDEWIARIHDKASLKAYVEHARGLIDANPAAWCAVELALLELFGFPAVCGVFRYSAVLGDATPAQFEAQLGHYIEAGFSQYKIKLSGNVARDAAKVRSLRDAGIEPGAVRADANNLFASPATAIEHITALDFPFFAIEEPLRAGDHEGMRAVGEALRARIVVDESLLRAAQLEALRHDPHRWIANIRVSKMGGVLRAIETVEGARRIGIPVIVGAHVGETSILTRAGLIVADRARDILVAQEGAFGTHLLERDVVDSPLMFGAAGLLHLAA